MKVKCYKVEVYDIDWETDGEDVELPNNVDCSYLDEEGVEGDELKCRIESFVTDFLSSYTGFLHNGYKFSYEQVY